MTSDPKNKKFLFDLHHFDIEAEEEARRKKTPPAPTFSLENMEDARAEAFEKGKEDGLKAAKDSIKQRVELVVQSLAGNIAALETEETKRENNFEQKSLILIHSALKKAFPDLLDRAASAQIKLFLADFFNESRIKSGFIVYVHPDIVSDITPYIDQLSADITLQPDAKLLPNASKIEWDKGHAFFDPDSMAEKLLGIIAEQVSNKAELLDESQKNPHNEIDTADSGTENKDT